MCLLGLTQTLDSDVVDVEFAGLRQLDGLDALVGGLAGAGLRRTAHTVRVLVQALALHLLDFELLRIALGRGRGLR